MSNDNQLRAFITKLNDRNLQRKRESGITSYALISVIIFCVYKLYKNIYVYFEYFNINEVNNMILSIFLCSNIFIASHYVLDALTIKKKIFSNLTLVKYNKNEFNLLEFIVYLILFTPPIITGIIAFINLNENSIISTEYFILIGLLNLLSVFILLDIFRSESKLEILNLEENNNPLRIIIIITSGVVLGFSIFYLSKIDLPEKLLFIKIIGIFYVIILLLVKYVEEDSQDKNFFNLENFEYEIYLKNLNDEAIRKKLQEKYIGFLLEFWIENNKNLVENYNKQKTKIENFKNSELAKLNNTVDKNQYSMEYKESEKIIINNYNNSLINIEKDIKTLKQEISTILKNEDKLDRSEKENIKYLNDELSKINIK